MDLVSRFKDVYGFASGFFGRPIQAEHFDLASIFGQSATTQLPQELDVEALINPFGVSTGTQALLARWAQPELESPDIRTPLGFLGAVEASMGTLREAAKTAQDPAQATLLKQGERELSQFHANAMLGWETANALRKG